MVRQTDGYRFFMESPRGIRTVRSDHVSKPPTPPARDAKWTRALRAQALFKEGTQLKDGPEYVVEKFIKHGWDDDGQLKLLVQWFGLPEKEATWQFFSSLPRDALRKYWLRKKIKLLALTREGVCFYDQVKKRVQDGQVARAGMETRVTKKTAKPLYSLRIPLALSLTVQLHPFKETVKGNTTNDRGKGVPSLRQTGDSYSAKVRWFDYGSKDDTWEPLENLPRNLVVRFLRQK